jgi:starch phosphorylase
MSFLIRPVAHQVAAERGHAFSGADNGEQSGVVAELVSAILDKLTYTLGQTASTARDRDWIAATALALRDRVVDIWARPEEVEAKSVAYLSMEFLIGRLTSDAAGNLGLIEDVRAALAVHGKDFDALTAQEPDAALGNGGLGRLAACFMESFASVGLPAVGYGIRYEHGLFRQTVRDGWQQEELEDWLSEGNPWEFERHDVAYDVGFGGEVELLRMEEGAISHIWRPAETIRAVAFDSPIVGWRGRRVDTLRLWSARVREPLQLEAFNAGDHLGAATARIRAEAITRLLYPSDATPAGQELRLRQEYFFTSASLQDLVARCLALRGSLSALPDFAAVQLNDTHPAIAVVELMRLLVDVHGLSWEEAWSITTRTLNYTNHTLLPEALETWPVTLMERLLPRHMQIIYTVNWLHLERLAKSGGLDDERIASLSVIEERGERRVRMGHLAFIGSRRVNGVSALHTDLMRTTVFKALHEAFPDRIVNKTNGITFRRWLHRANPALTALLVETLGQSVLDDASLLAGLRPHAADPAFQQRFAASRFANKTALARVVENRIGLAVDPSALFDIQIKRIHEYKRQLLNILETVAAYHDILRDPDGDHVPRVKIFAGKAAASYTTAKRIIKLANDVARVVNADPIVAGRLRVAYLPNYNVSLAEVIIPAADLSEQISTAGMEASGTGNMKFALNGALTIGTLDGANVEIRDHVGAENIVIFGLTAAEAAERLSRGVDASGDIADSPCLAAVLDAIASGRFSPDDPARYLGLVEDLRHHDRFLLCADFESYRAAQRRVAALWRDQSTWWRHAILNTAGMAWFSSDRTVREYADEVWQIKEAV